MGYYRKAKKRMVQSVATVLLHTGSVRIAPEFSYTFRGVVFLTPIDYISLSFVLLVEDHIYMNYREN